MNMPQLGAKVHVWPTLPNVQDGAGAFGRFLQADGREVVMDEWWASRLLDGSISLSDPRPVAPKKVEK